MVAALVILTLTCYSQTWRFGFINLDDPVYASENRHVREGISLPGIAWAFTTFEGANWHPVTWLSLMADRSLFGPGPGGHHITNSLLHLANTLLVFFVFSQMTAAPKRSALLAALFAVHPLHVESVAWISERKDVLSTFFGFLSIGCYARYAAVRRPGTYFFSFLFLCLGLMSKPLLVTWPCLLLLLDYWPLRRLGHPTVADGVRGWLASLGRLRGPVLDKLPMMVPVVLLSAATFAAQKGSGAVIAASALDLKSRIANALVSYVAYLGKAVWPAELSVFYPYPDPAALLWPAAGALLLLALLTGLALQMSKKAPYLPVGWFWFLGTLVPMIGLVQVGTQAMADRYMYVPLIGLGIVVIWGGNDLWRRTGWDRRVLGGIAAVILIFLTMAGYRQVRLWENSLTLFQHAVAVDPENDLAHNNLGTEYDRRGETEEAERHFRKALEINPFNASAANNLAGHLLEGGNFTEAERLYRRAVEFDPTWPAFRYNYGVMLFRTGRVEEAIAQFAEALKLDPTMARVYNYMGIALARQGDRQKAESFFKRALEVDPTFVPARRNLERWQPQDTGQP
jgi:Tfp pilus assembly protein PilF